MTILAFQLVSILDTAKFYGVSVPTLRRWDKQGKLKLILEKHCDLVLQDLGSGLNCKKPRLRKLVAMLLAHKVSELHLTVLSGHFFFFVLTSFTFRERNKGNFVNSNIKGICLTYICRSLN